jgi:3-hydroxyisobutyrate dehydrogenase-like beta-hydroxyacid dehydrogenase
MSADAPVGIVGLGLMGIALSARLIDAKIPLIGFDIDPVRCGMFKASGGMVATSVRELAAHSRTIILAVYNAAQVEALFADIDGGTGAAPPVVICTTTCGPGEITAIAGRASRARIALVEAPISGTSTEVLDGTATALLAGDDGIIDQVGDLLNILCPRSLRVGAIGDASRAKLAINLILQNNRAALAEGLAFAERLGLDGHTFLAAARQSAAYSRVMDSKGEKMLTRDYRPQSHIAQTLKDAELIIEEAGRCGLHLPLTAIQTELLRAAIALEGPDRDSSAVIEAIRRRPASQGALR